MTKDLTMIDKLRELTRLSHIRDSLKSGIEKKNISFADLIRLSDQVAPEKMGLRIKEGEISFLDAYKLHKQQKSSDAKSLEEKLFVSPSFSTTYDSLTREELNKNLFEADVRFFDKLERALIDDVKKMQQDDSAYSIYVMYNSLRDDELKSHLYEPVVVTTKQAASPPVHALFTTPRKSTTEIDKIVDLYVEYDIAKSEFEREIYAKSQHITLRDMISLYYLQLCQEWENRIKNDSVTFSQAEAEFEKQLNEFHEFDRNGIVPARLIPPELKDKFQPADLDKNICTDAGLRRILNEFVNRHFHHAEGETKAEAKSGGSAFKFPRDNDKNATFLFFNNLIGLVAVLDLQDKKKLNVRPGLDLSGR